MWTTFFAPRPRARRGRSCGGARGPLQPAIRGRERRERARASPRRPRRGERRASRARPRPSWRAPGRAPPTGTATASASAAARRSSSSGSPIANTRLAASVAGSCASAARPDEVQRVGAGARRRRGARAGRAAHSARRACRPGSASRSNSRSKRRCGLQLVSPEKRGAAASDAARAAHCAIGLERPRARAPGRASCAARADTGEVVQRLARRSAGPGESRRTARRPSSGHR